MAVVRILGIDPGTMVVGYGCLELATAEAVRAGAVPLALAASNVVRSSGQGQLQVVAAGALRLGGRGDAIAERLQRLLCGFMQLLDELRPDEIALEEAFHGKSVQSALRIGEARGVVLAESGRRRLPVHQFPPARVKRCVTGQGAAAKEIVAEMLRRQLPGFAGAAELPADATDALAIAMTRAEARRSPLLAVMERPSPG